MIKLRKISLLLTLVMIVPVLLAACGAGVAQEDYDAVVAERDAAQAQVTSVQAQVTSLQAAAQKAAPSLNIEIGAIGHWHFTKDKLLTFTVTDANDKPVTGLKPTVTVKTSAGSVDMLEEVVDNDDGTYSAEYTAIDLGSGYSVGYSIGITFSYEGFNYSNHWPAEVVRDGNERIMPTLGGTMYSYQVRFAWVPGRIAVGDEVTMYLEPRRAHQTGDQLNTEQPWRNTFDHPLDLENVSVVVETAAGSPVATLTPTYSGLGIYQAKYTPTSAGEYKVSFLFTDPFNGFTIDKAETSYPLVVR